MMDTRTSELTKNCQRQHYKALTWSELADKYDVAHCTGRPSRTLPMSTVFDWAEKRGVFK